MSGSQDTSSGSAPRPINWPLTLTLDSPRRSEEVESASLPEIPAHSIASYEAFLHDLPELMQTHPGLCAAYQNGQRMGLGRRCREFYKELNERGCDPQQLLVFTIEPQEAVEIELLTPEI